MNPDPKLAEMEKEIDNMSLEELLYVRMAPQIYINKKFENEINDSNRLIQEIEANSQTLKSNEDKINSQKAQIKDECNRLKMEIEQTKDRINNLLLQKRQLNKQPTKEEFIRELDNEIRSKFITPDNLFRDFLAKKISQEDFGKKLKELGKGKNYYYYKILSDKLKEM